MAGRIKPDRALAQSDLKACTVACITLGRLVTEPASNSTASPKPRGWSLVAAGFLLLALVLVVSYTSRGAFLSPLALVVVAAIGLAALLFQLRLRKDVNTGVHAPLWINILGLVFALAAVCADFAHLSANMMLVAALGAVVCFSISGVSVIRALRKQKI